MLLQENVKIDFIVEFYDQGLHSILERIVLRLPPRTILSCKEVNNNWRQIILFYHQAENTRIAKIQDQRISEEWKKKTPIIYKLSLEKFQINHVSCFQITGDKIQIIIAANINHTKFAKIIIVNADTLEVDCILDLKNEDEKDLEVLELKIAVDKNFLAAFVADGNNQQFYRVWNRSDNYLENPVQRVWQPGHPKATLLYIGTHIANIPFLKEGRLQISRREFIVDPIYTYEEWDLVQNTTHQLTEVIPEFDYYIRRIFKLRNGMLALHALHNTLCKMLSYQRGNSVVWTKSFGASKQPTLIGFDEEYFALQQFNLINNDNITIFKVETGQPVFSFYSRRGKELSLDCEAQISNNRVAYKGSICPNLNYDWTMTMTRSDIDLVIMNLGTGEKIISCSKDIGFPKISRFLLQKEKLIFEQDGSLHVALFWT